MYLSTQLSYIHPRLLSSLILIDPVIHGARSPFNRSNSTTKFARSSTFRRDVWPSRAQAATSFKKSEFYRIWDPRVFDLWIKHGLRDLPTAIYPEHPDPQELNLQKISNGEGPPVTLATTKAQEVHMFLRPNFEGKDKDGNITVNPRTHPDIDLSTTEIYPFYRPETSAVYKNLPHLRPSTLYLFGGTSELSQPESRKQKLDITGTGVGGNGGLKAGRVKEVVVEGVGHLVPMIAPKVCGLSSADFLVQDLKRWRTEEEEFRKENVDKSKLERMAISEEWKKHIGGDPKLKPPAKL